MKWGAFVLLCGLGFAAGLRAAPMTTFSAGDPVLEDIRYVAREAGVSILSFTPPLSRDEIDNILAAVEPERLSLPAREAYRRIQERLDPPMRLREDFFALSFHVVAQAEAAFRTNTAIPWDADEFPRPAFLHFPLDFYFADAVHLNLEMAARLEPSYNEDDSPFLANVPYPLKRIDKLAPFRAFAAAGGKWWHFQIGRDQISFGTAHTGNLLLSNTPDFYEFARLSLFSRHFKYSALVIQSPITLSSPYYDPSGLGDSVPTTSIQRYVYIHRVDFKIFNRIAVGLTEGLSVGDSPLELRYLNPLMIMHNFFGHDYDRWDAGGVDSQMNSSTFSVDVNWAPVPAVALYAQMVIDEFTLSSEVQDDPKNVTPTGMGYLVGVEYGRAFGAWGAQFYAEAAYTDPYLYVDNSPFAAFVWMRHMFRDSMEYRYRWIGHPEGRDAIVFAAGSRFSRNDRLAFSAGLSLVIHGEHGIRWDWALGDTYASERTPTGTPEKRLVLSLGAEWKPVPQVTLSAKAGGGASFNANHSSNDEFGGWAELGIKYVF
jgi:hypothetical protein